MSTKRTTMMFLIAGLVTSFLFYFWIFPSTVQYFDNSQLPLLIRFILYECVSILLFYFFFAIVTRSVSFFKKFSESKRWFMDLRYALGAWLFYHFIDWAEAPWTLGRDNILTKTTAWSVSLDTLGASFLCKCQDAGSTLICDSGCFTRVYIVVPVILVTLAVFMFGPELSSFVKSMMKN